MRGQKNLIRADKGERSFSLLGYFFMAAVSLICLIPFWLIVSGSLSSEQSVVRYGFSLLPRDFCFDAYRSIFSGWERILRSYLVTIGITALGTGLSLMLTSMGGYVLQRQDFPYRNKLSFFVYFTTLFSGGLIPTYILMVTYLNMKNNDSSAVQGGVGHSGAFHCFGLLEQLVFCQPLYHKGRDVSPAVSVVPVAFQRGISEKSGGFRRRYRSDTNTQRNPENGDSGSGYRSDYLIVSLCSEVFCKGCDDWLRKGIKWDFPFYINEILGGKT